MFAKKLFFILYLVFFIFFKSSTLFCQEKDENVSFYINQLISLWDKTNTQTFDAYIIDSSLTLASDPFYINAQLGDVQYKNMLIKQNALKQEINKKDLGFQLTVNFQENFKSPIADPEEIVIFKRRAIAGLDWDILKNGFFDNRWKNKILQEELKLLEQKNFTNNVYAFQSIQKEQLIKYFNTKKLEILKARESLNKEQVLVIEKLWSIKHITKDNYLKAIQNTTDIDAQYNLYGNYNEVKTPNQKELEVELPLLEIDIATILTTTTTDTIDKYATNYENIAKYKSKQLNEISLKAYTRYNYYDVYNSNQPNRSYVSVGMNLAVPLTFTQKRKQELYILQNQIDNYKQKHISGDMQANILNLYYEYQYKLKQFKNLYHKRLVYMELIRTERAKQALTDLEFNPNTALFILDDYWSNSIELLDLKQDLYKTLLSIKALVPHLKLTEYTKPLTLQNLKIASSNPPFKAVYIWSDAFKNHSEEIINEYCKVNEFNHLMISYNTTKTHLQKLTHFIASNNKAQVHLMIGSNKLLNTGIAGYLDTLITNIKLTNIKGIHLDIEPHTVDGFKENPTALFEKYITVLKQAYAFAQKNKLELSVSIPLSYPENVLSEINKVCDNVYLMAYENVDKDFILRKSAEEKTIFKNKCVLAFRTKDFKNRTEMDALLKTMGFSKTAYHDLDDLIKFDNTSINAKDEGK